MPKTTVQGNCFICGKTAAKIAIKNHILKEHNNGDEECLLLKAEGAYNKNYWLLFSVPLNASLLAVDKFLRQIWCECCGHLSEFQMNGDKFPMSRKVSALYVGDVLVYEYDFGSTTHILLTAVCEISRPKQRGKVCLYARNEPHIEICGVCGKPATQIISWNNDLLCDDCAEKVEDEEALLPVVNSPRCGECGYTGEQDKWTFDHAKLFPRQTSK